MNPEPRLEAAAGLPAARAGAAGRRRNAAHRRRGLRPQQRADHAADGRGHVAVQHHPRSEEHTSELQSLMRISYAVFCLKKKTPKKKTVNSTDLINNKTI